MLERKESNTEIRHGETAIIKFKLGIILLCVAFLFPEMTCAQVPVGRWEIDGSDSIMVYFYDVVGGICNDAGGVDAPFHLISGKPILHGAEAPSSWQQADSESRPRSHPSTSRLESSCAGACSTSEH